MLAAYDICTCCGEKLDHVVMIVPADCDDPHSWQAEAAATKFAGYDYWQLCDQCGD